MTTCRVCAGLAFCWGWGHGPTPKCPAHRLWAYARRWFERVTREVYRERVSAKRAMQAAKRERREARKSFDPMVGCVTSHSGTCFADVTCSTDCKWATEKRSK